MRFVVEDGHLVVYAAARHLAPGVQVEDEGAHEVRVLAVPLQPDTNNEHIVEPMAHGMASVLEAGWQTPAAKVRDIVAINEHPEGAYSWLSMQRNGACEGVNILDAVLDLGIHFIMNHEDRERHLGDQEYEAISSDDGLVLEVCQALLENIDVPPLFADSGLLTDGSPGAAADEAEQFRREYRDEQAHDTDIRQNGSDPAAGNPDGDADADDALAEHALVAPPTWRDYEEYYEVTTEQLMQRLALGEIVAHTPAEWEERADWLWSYEQFLRDQWRRTVVDHLLAELNVLRQRLEDLEVERQRIGDAIARLEEQGARFSEG